VAGAAFLSEYSEAGISGLISDGAVGFSAGGTLEFAADRGTHLWQWSGSAWSAVAVPGTIQSSVFGPGGQFAAVLTNGTIAMRSGSGSGWTIIPAGPSEAAYTYLADGTLTYTVQDGQADAVYAWSGTAWTLVAPAPSGTAVALFSQ
jgi:hypothetical protein